MLKVNIVSKEIEDILTEYEICIQQRIMPDVFRTDLATKESGDDNRKLSRDRVNEVNKGFILWLCWIAICSYFVEKTRQHFCCLKFFSSIYTVWVDTRGAFFVVTAGHNN